MSSYMVLCCLGIAYFGRELALALRDLWRDVREFKKGLR